jgi:hypothetical protein
VLPVPPVSPVSPVSPLSGHCLWSRDSLPMTFSSPLAVLP